MKVKAYAKINLSLDITGAKDGFHQLDTLVSTINLFDVVSVSKRKDDKIVLRCVGKDVCCTTQNNNAYKAAKLFTESFKTGGVNVTVKKNIPIGGGLGGSSADIAGVLVALKKLFKLDCDIVPLANELGSDSGFMTKGGFAELKGKGDIITPVNGIKLYIIIITESKPVVTRDCYAKYDQMEIKNSPCTASAIGALNNGNIKDFLKVLKNDLKEPAVAILPKIQDNIFLLEKVGAEIALMTGSGSSCYGVFTDKKSRDKAYKLLGKTVSKIKAETTT